MNLSEIVTAARQRLEDETQPYLFSTSRLEYWANEANIEACRRSRYLVDNTQSVSLVSGTSDYDNPDNVIFIKRGKISSVNKRCFSTLNSLAVVISACLNCVSRRPQ